MAVVGAVVVVTPMIDTVETRIVVVDDDDAVVAAVGAADMEARPAVASVGRGWPSSGPVVVGPCWRGVATSWAAPVANTGGEEHFRIVVTANSPFRRRFGPAPALVAYRTDRASQSVPCPPPFGYALCHPRAYSYVSIAPSSTTAPASCGTGYTPKLPARGVVN